MENNRRMTYLTGQLEIQAKANIEAWKKYPPSRISDVFLQINPPNGSDQENQSGLGYSDQFSRIVGVDFGQVHPDFMKFVQNFEPGDSEKGLSMVLAIEHPYLSVFLDSDLERGSSEIPNPQSKFQLYLQTIEPGIETEKECKYYGTEPGDNRSYDILPDPIRPTNQRFGISTELRNQFVFNWQAMPASLLGDLFSSSTNAKKITNNVLAEAIAVAFPRETALVRIHKYIISGKNLETLKKLLSFDNGSEQCIRISLGTNTSDLLINEDPFTLIVEVRENLPKLDFNVDILKSKLGSGPELTIETRINGLEMQYHLFLRLNSSGAVATISSEELDKKFPVDYDTLIEVNLGTQYLAKIYVTPLFVVIKIKDKRPGYLSRGVVRLPVKDIMNSIENSVIESTEVESSVPILSEPTLGEATYLEFVGACPPACPSD